MEKLFLVLSSIDKAKVNKSKKRKRVRRYDYTQRF